jgi:hypothetical protein
MLRFSLVCVMIMTIVNGCATPGNFNQERMQALPQKYSQFDAKLAWEIKSIGDSTVVDGVVQNIRYYEMDELEIWISELDDKGKDVHRAAAFINSLRENETGQFSVALPRVKPGTKLRFLYHYVGHDGGTESGSASRWSQAFEASVP